MKGNSVNKCDIFKAHNLWWWQSWWLLP